MDSETVQTACILIQRKIVCNISIYKRWHIDDHILLQCHKHALHPFCNAINTYRKIHTQTRQFNTDTLRKFQTDYDIFS